MYANWLTTTTSNLSAVDFSNNFVTPPDVLLELGVPPITARFWAHSQIICQYSGYLRSAIANSLINSSSTTTTLLPSIFIPNVPAEHFEPLLRYMYSGGYLDLNVNNIFGVLLATHVLHMPHALEICRSFISNMQAQGLMPTGQEESSGITQNNNGKTLVLKPIPNKPTQTCSAITSPSSPTVLVPSSSSTFHTLYLPSPKEPVVVLQPHSESSSSSFICPSFGVSRSSPKQHSKSNNSKKGIIAAATIKTINHNEKQLYKVIVDVASCDGPVRFRRVLNEFSNPKSSPYKPIVNNSPRNFFVNSSFHQQMAQDINERRLCEDTETSSSQDTDHSKYENNHKCDVCKHTFKSKFCYMKHAKRHLIPLIRGNVENTIKSEAQNGSLFFSDEKVKNPAKSVETANATQIREIIRPLDMNVQYYPCKTCGCKFPSYYFVHKHRKLCHPPGTGSPLPEDCENDTSRDSVDITGEKGPSQLDGISQR